MKRKMMGNMDIDNGYLDFRKAKAYGPSSLAIVAPERPRKLSSEIRVTEYDFCFLLWK